MAQTQYKSVARTVQGLIMEVESGKLSLPELQRGYVWNATKVRELLDSMMKRYPMLYYHYTQYLHLEYALDN